MQAGIKVESGREAFHRDIHTHSSSTRPVLKGGSCFLLLPKQTGNPGSFQKITLQPCRAVAGASCWAALIEVGADDPAPAFLSSQSFTLHSRPRRDKHPDDLQQGRTDNETPH